MNFNEICKAIKEVKIQGAENIAIAALKALRLRSNDAAINTLMNLRPTEPCLRNAIKFALRDLDKNINYAIAHFKFADQRINKIGAKKIKNNSIIFTHCHSSSVIGILKEAKKQEKKFEVYCTETRPLYQGRKTARELTKLKIPVTMFIDSAARIALKKVNTVLLGCDAITTDKVFNKVGSEMFCEIADQRDLNVYIATDSWKFDPESIYGQEEKIEERPAKEIWENAPKSIKISTFAFEKINPDLITAIISELGSYKHTNFIYEVEKTYPWMLE